MPEKIFVLPDRDAPPYSVDWMHGASRDTHASPNQRAWAEYVARVVEAVPDHWSDLSGLLESSVSGPARGTADAPVANTGYELHRFGGGLRIVGRRLTTGGRHGDDREVVRPDLVSLLLEGRPPAFLSFDDTGYGDPQKFMTARALAAGFIRRGYLGWLSLNNGRGRDGAHEKPAEVELHLSPWSGWIETDPGCAARRPLPPAIVLRWDERYGGAPEQLESIRSCCQAGCHELAPVDVGSPDGAGR